MSKKHSQKSLQSEALTPFQKRCYALLLQIPKGKVTSYGELARALKTPGFRAVGQCVGANPFAPEIPCHRVVRSDGNLGGYSGGLSKKRALLKQEGIEIRSGKISDFREHFHSFR